ncbi:MAG TPA: transferrin receptor-like dimerization domain-containing protein [Candidatus Binatia bacterium]|nr:transferrin receptor-like dimerization domain-containing protein [Candidatus Binatia bacterium]
MRPSSRRLYSLGFALLLACGLAPAGAGQEPVLDGYSAAGSKTERDWEAKYRALPDPKIIRDNMEHLSARPHHVGSPYDKQNAEWMLGKFKEWGWDARIETFEVLYPTPKRRLVEMTAPARFTAKLEEPSLSVDPTSQQKSEQLPTYHVYSIDGDVTAPVVYANYGLPEDYEQLERMGVNVKGAIALVRYGRSWRGIKPKIAGEHGAVACLIYSDPRDDGYFDDAVFPNGPMRPADGVQRGSVEDFPWSFPGDPLWFDRGDPSAPHYTAANAPGITKIPVMPISYGDAQPLLAALGGQVVPEGWRGALPITYRTGPGPTQVHFVLQSNWDMKTLYDVIARMPGAAEPDEWIVRGNHHDAWVNGADDPISGQAALLEEARSIGELARQGWRPKRTLIYCAWDGEEPGLLGSTAWAEVHGKELQQHAVLYINSDSNSRGFLFFSGSHALEHFLNGVARDVTDPETKLSVQERRRLAAIGNAHSPAERAELRAHPDVRLQALGSGSDYTVFIDRLGVASLNLGFGGETRSGIYHSIYDDFYWYTHFGDTDFVYGRALAQTVGTAVLRMSGADLLPFDFTALADTVRGYARECQDLLKKEQDEARDRNQQLREGVFKATNDPQHPLDPPKEAVIPPFLNFAPLENAVESLSRAADHYRRAVARAREHGSLFTSEEALRPINGLLIGNEQRLLDSAGLPHRPWYRHMLYAPGLYTGYGVKTLPGVREAIEQKKWDEADAEIARVSRVLGGEAGYIDALALRIEQASGSQ